MPILTRDQILSSTDLKRELVDVPEWGGSVYVRELTATERDELELACWQESQRSGRPLARHYRARLVAMSVCDENGKPLFTASDVDALAAKSGRVIGRLTDVAGRLAGISKADREELEGNSEAAPSGDSSSSSA